MHKLLNFELHLPKQCKKKAKFRYHEEMLLKNKSKAKEEWIDSETFITKTNFTEILTLPPNSILRKFAQQSQTESSFNNHSDKIKKTKKNVLIYSDVQKLSLIVLHFHVFQSPTKFLLSLSSDIFSWEKFAKLIVDLKLIPKFDIEGGFKAS